MILKKSPLQHHEFFVLNSSYNFIDLEIDSNGNSVALVAFPEYELDFDFTINFKENGFFLIFTKISINTSDKPLQGYKIFAECVSIFSFEKNVKLDDKVKGDYIYISALSIAINNMRTYIANMTSYGPHGKYLLPAIDVASIHQEKIKSIKNSKA